MRDCPNHFENLIIFGACGMCKKVWGLGTQPEDLQEALKHTDV